MSRRKVVKLSALAVVLGAVGFSSGRGTSDPAGVQSSDFPDLWQWDLTRMTPPDTENGIRVILRSRVQSPTVPPPPPMQAPLRAGPGASDRVLGSDTLADGFPDDARVAMQLVDVRQLGLSAPETTSPLRLQAVLRLYGSRSKAVAKLNGHSVRGRPVLHVGGWADGERPIMSFATAGAGGHTEYTILLSTNPGFD